MEEIPSPPLAEGRPKTTAEKFIERMVAWAVLGGFVFGIFGAALGVIAILFLEWEIPGIWILSPIFTSFLVGTIFGAVFGSLIGVMIGVLRPWLFGDSRGREKHQSSAPQNLI